MSQVLFMGTLTDVLFLKKWDVISSTTCLFFTQQCGGLSLVGTCRSSQHLHITSPYPSIRCHNVYFVSPSLVGLFRFSLTQGSALVHIYFQVIIDIFLFKKITKKPPKSRIGGSEGMKPHKNICQFIGPPLESVSLHPC